MIPPYRRPTRDDLRPEPPARPSAVDLKRKSTVGRQSAVEARHSPAMRGLKNAMRGNVGAGTHHK